MRNDHKVFTSPVTNVADAAASHNLKPKRELNSKCRFRSIIPDATWRSERSTRCLLMTNITLSPLCHTADISFHKDTIKITSAYLNNELTQMPWQISLVSKQLTLSEFDDRIEKQF